MRHPLLPRRPYLWLSALLLSACTSSVDVLLPPEPPPQEAGPPQPDAQAPATAVTKVDLLFVVDNSMSMSDKQQVLHLAARELIGRLTNPLCIGLSMSQPESGTAPCPSGTQREFAPVTDMHVGVISTSLGGHGGKACSPASSQYNAQQDERARLLSRGPGSSTIPTYDNKGFLNWDPGQKDNPPGQNDNAQFETQLGNLIEGVGEIGCGYESTLEAWYRFLVDPKPYQELVPSSCSLQDPSQSCRAPYGTDSVLLQQRADFLRPDSLVTIVMITDENDCSIIDKDQGYLFSDGIAPSGQMLRGTAACQSAPDSDDCMPCMAVTDAAAHPECASPFLDPLEDSSNLRCFHQKQRFGVDFLYPIERYVKALTEPKLDNGSYSPLYCQSIDEQSGECKGPLRDRSQIVLGGIVGVPWQDLARNPNDLKQGYRSSKELDWDLIAGVPEHYRAPKDPLMVESIEPRQGINPPTGQALSTEPLGNTINGSEWPNTTKNDLQYACVFPLPTPHSCTTPGDNGYCECRGAPPEKPLCWDQQTQQYSTTQYRAKAYPSIRPLAVLKGLGEQAVVGSICPAQLVHPEAADYGYQAFAEALLGRMKLNLPVD